MKNLFNLAFLLLPLIGLTQYTWTAGTNPGWVSTGDGNKDLAWQAGCAVVTTNCTGNYNANELSYYTSPVMTIPTCQSVGSTMIMTFTASGNAEYSWDFLFIEYSIDGGTTWINPYGVGIGWTGNFGAGSTIPGIVIPSSANRFRFTFDSDNSFQYSGYKITDFDIVCNIVLDVELKFFDGEKIDQQNRLFWEIENQTNNMFYTIEHSDNGYEWSVLQTVSQTQSKEYSVLHDNPRHIVNYYRLSQTDFDGSTEILGMIAIDNTVKQKTIVSRYNLLGQLVDEYATGIVIEVYEDGTINKIFK